MDLLWSSSYCFLNYYWYCFLVAHRAAAAEFAEMCQELSAIISSDSSFTAASVAAVKAFKKIKDCPSKIMEALHMFGSYTNTSLASLRSRAIQRAARHSSVVRRRIRLGERRPLVGHNKFTMRRDHVYCQWARRVQTQASHYLAHSVWGQKRLKTKETVTQNQVLISFIQCLHFETEKNVFVARYSFTFARK